MSVAATATNRDTEGIVRAHRDIGDAVGIEIGDGDEAWREPYGVGRERGPEGGRRAGCGREHERACQHEGDDVEHGAANAAPVCTDTSPSGRRTEPAANRAHGFANTTLRSRCTAPAARRTNTMPRATRAPAASRRFHSMWCVPAWSSFHA